VYHSSRYVNDIFVMRLNAPLPESAVEQLNQDFADILVEGKIEQSVAHTQEAGELPEKPRLHLHFNRHRHGRLRQMIDRINIFDVPITPTAPEPQEAIVVE